MKNSTEHKTFIFNDKIDKDLLNSLYEDDFPYMEEIFSITLTQLKPDLVILKTAYEKGDWSGLQKAVHKIKPSFGFVGLPQMQQLCKQFEDSCANPDFAGQSASQYNLLCTELEESIHIIETEQARLKEYNLAG